MDYGGRVLVLLWLLGVLLAGAREGRVGGGERAFGEGEGEGGVVRCAEVRVVDVHVALGEGRLEGALEGGWVEGEGWSAYRL